MDYDFSKTTSSGDVPLLTGLDADCAQVRNILSLHLGECIFDLSRGIAWIKFSDKQSDYSLLKDHIKKEITYAGFHEIGDILLNIDKSKRTAEVSVLVRGREVKVGAKL